MNVTNLEYVYDDGEVIYMFDGKGYYGKLSLKWLKSI